jgi:hypothetical protein
LNISVNALSRFPSHTYHSAAFSNIPAILCNAISSTRSLNDEDELTLRRIASLLSDIKTKSLEKRREASEITAQQDKLHNERMKLVSRVEQELKKGD